MNNFVNTTFCRLCLNVTEGQQTADLAGDRELYTILENVFPGMKLDLVPMPKICLTCKEKLQLAYTFKKTVLSNEQKIDSNKDYFVIATDVCRLCLKGKLGEGFVYLYENNNCSYSYQLIRTVTEIATAPLKFDLFEKPIMCTECWSTVKQISGFKKRCFDNEEKLRNLYKNTNNGLNSLSIEEVLTAVICIEKALIRTTNKEDTVSQDIKNVKTYSTENDPISGSDSDNDLPDSNNKDEHSDSESDEDIFDETLNDDVVEIRIKNRKRVDDTKLRNIINLRNNDSIIDVGTSENIRSVAEVIPSVKEELVKQEISVEEYYIDHDDFARFKEERQISVRETSLVTPSNHHNVKTETTKQHTLSQSSNPPTKMDKSLTIHLIDCVKYQSNLNITNISTETGQISHSHSVLRTNNPPKRTIKCGECEFVTSSKEIMTRHMEKHILYSDTGNKCPSCQKVYRNPDILEEHIQSCEGSSKKKVSGKKSSKATRKCGKCSFTTIWPQIFKRHMLQHAKKKKCNNNEITTNETTGCGEVNLKAIEGSNPPNVLKEFSGALKKSANIESKIYQCLICSSYKSESYRKYESHLKNKHNRRFVCDICHKSFKKNWLLKKHRLSHFKDKKYICDVCQKGFNEYSAWIIHKRVHSDARDYICPDCQKSFKHRSNLNRHVESHRSEKSFICYICQKSFKTKYLVRAHLLTYHVDKNYTCDICEKSFKTSTQLSRHRRTHYEERKFVCDICQMCLKTSWNLKKHRIHAHSEDRNFICDVCHKGFTCKYTLKNHQLSHKTDRNEICHICREAFKSRANLKQHIGSHIAERSFICYICQKGFKRKCYLEKHLQIHRGDDAPVAQ